MKKIQRMVVLGIVLLALLLPVRSVAFLGDGGAGWAQIPYLVKILAENVKRYQQLRMVIEQAKGHEQYLRLINSGIENSIDLLNSIPVRDEGLLEQLRDFQSAYNNVLEIYGQIPKSKEATLQLLHDQLAAESRRMTNSFKEYAREQEENSITLAVQSRQASPKGAQRMQAEASAHIMRSLSQLIRLNTQMLKLQSEQLAMNNKQGKDRVAAFQKFNEDLGGGFKKFKPEMNLTRF